MKLQPTPLAQGVLATVDEGQGPPLLLVHGFPLSHAMWREQIAAFSGSHRVIAPDLRGFGASPPANGQATVTMEQLADDLAELLEARGVGEPVTLVGLSMGGYIAWPFFRRHRQRLAALVLCDTRAAGDHEETARGRGALAARVLREGSGILVEAMLPRLIAAETPARLPLVVAAVKQMIESTPPAGAAAALRGMALRGDATPWLGSVDVPTLLVVGESDAITPVAEMRSVSESIPGARLEVIPQAGHLAPLENPEAVNQALRQFLDGR